MLRNGFVERLFEGLTAWCLGFLPELRSLPASGIFLKELLATEPGEMKHMFEGGEGLAL